MKCPKCSHSTQVLETRSSTSEYRRRRECLHCGHRFSTIEVCVVPGVGRVASLALSTVAPRTPGDSSLEQDIASAIIATERRRAEIRQQRRDAILAYNPDLDEVEIMRELRGY